MSINKNKKKQKNKSKEKKTKKKQKAPRENTNLKRADQANVPYLVRAYGRYATTQHKNPPCGGLM